jgi:hypothetical protein
MGAQLEIPNPQTKKMAWVDVLALFKLSMFV